MGSNLGSHRCEGLKERGPKLWTLPLQALRHSPVLHSHLPFLADTLGASCQVRAEAHLPYIPRGGRDEIKSQTPAMLTSFCLTSGFPGLFSKGSERKAWFFLDVRVTLNPVLYFRDRYTDTPVLHGSSKCENREYLVVNQQQCHILSSFLLWVILISFGTILYNLKPEKHVFPCNVVFKLCSRIRKTMGALSFSGQRTMAEGKKTDLISETV